MCDQKEKGKKKNRGANFSKEEELLLVQEVEKEKLFIECKTTNKISSAEKEKAWDRITAKYNSKTFQCRSCDQLKSKYDNLKILARKVVASKRTYCKGTGGGPFLGDDLDPVVEAILKVINIKTVVGINYTCDSDGLSNEYVATLNGSQLETPSTSTSYYHEESIPIVVTIDDTYNVVSINETGTLDIDSEGTSQGAEIERVGNTLFNSHETVTEMEPAELTPKATSLKRKMDPDWSNYVPRKLKDPVSKKLRATVPNPLNKLKEELYALKIAYLKCETEAQKQRFEMAVQEEERKQAEHNMKMKIYHLECEKLQKDLCRN